MEFLPLIASSFAVILGLGAVLFPNMIASVVGLSWRSSLGEAEFRATFGGMFIGWGSLALWMQSTDVFVAFGAGWLLAGVVRAVVSSVRGAWGVRNTGGVVFEVGMGLALLVPVMV